MGFYVVGSLLILVGIGAMAFRRQLTAAVLDPDRPHPGINNPPAGTSPGMFQAKQAIIGAVAVVFGVVMIVYGATH
jgi:hypothetical protein